MSEEIEVALKNLITNEVDAYNTEVFRKLYTQFRTEPSTIDWNQMKLLDAKHQIDYETISTNLDWLNSKNEVNTVLSRLAVVKLNGGLGTTMHCSDPKSLIELRDGLSFLDFVLLQNQKLNEKYDSNVPLLLMNSFNTDVQTKEALENKSAALTQNVRSFTQSKCPRIYVDTLLPVPNSPSDRIEDGWYPPGHGNVFQSMEFEGILDELLAEGRDICFFSNIDNTGACVELAIAKAMCDGIADYLMEVTPKTLTDIKGGTLIEINGSLMHLEMPQVPKNRIDEFCSLKTFKIFNTNNIWVNLRAVKEALPRMKMEILANHKKLGANDNFRPVIQLETSIGGAIRNFERALCVTVGRHRFLPVKSTQELLPLMSNAYYIDFNDYVIKLGTGTRPIAILSPTEFYAPIQQFRIRFPCIPDMKELKSLRINGDVTFGKNVKLVGDIEIQTEESEQKFIEDNSILTNKCV